MTDSNYKEINDNISSTEYVTSQMLSLKARTRKRFNRTISLDIPLTMRFYDEVRKKGLVPSQSIEIAMRDYLLKWFNVDMNDPKELIKGWELYYKENIESCVGRFYHNRKFDGSTPIVFAKKSTIKESYKKQALQAFEEYEQFCKENNLEIDQLYIDKYFQLFTNAIEHFGLDDNE